MLNGINKFVFTILFITYIAFYLPIAASGSAEPGGETAQTAHVQLIPTVGSPMESLTTTGNEASADATSSVALNPTLESPVQSSQTREAIVPLPGKTPVQKTINASRQESSVDKNANAPEQENTFSGNDNEKNNVSGFSKTNEEIKPLGYSLLSAKPSEPGTGHVILDDYIIKPGDEIIIDIWGDINLHYKLSVEQDGYIDVPRTGRIYIHGMVFKEAKSKILKALSQTYSAFIDSANPGAGSSIVDITTGRALAVRLFITGEVNRPGEIIVDAASASIINVLIKAGGVKLSGSLRNITIKKLKNGQSHDFDLYDFLLKGKLKPEDKYLNDGDIVYVPLKGKVVTLEGEVAKPGIYELKPGENLDKLVEIAGGILLNAIKDKVKIERFDPVKGEEFLDIDLTKNRDIELVPRDKITFSTMPAKKILDIVYVNGGGIKTPGVYEYRKDLTIGNLIDQAGGLYNDAYLDNVIILRTKTDLSKEIIKLNLNDQGFGKKNKSFTLEPMDRISIYSAFEMKGADKYVSISGAVHTPGKFLLNKDMTLQDLLFMAGGFDDPDRDKKIFMERGDLFRKKAQGESEIIPFNIYAVLNGSNNIALLSGDSVKIYTVNEYIPKKYVGISGEVRKPGNYVLTENMNLADLIRLAGGMTEAASTDRIDIGRVKTDDGKVKKESVVLNYDNSHDFLLKDKDIIIVRQNPYYALSKAEITLEGKVKFPGKYNYIENEKIMSSIARAGGFKENVRIGKATLTRDGIVSDIYLNDAMDNAVSTQNVVICPGDVVKVMEIQPWVYVNGPVARPGRYVYKSGEDYSYYVEMAGGYKKDFSPGEILIKTYTGRIMNAKCYYWLNPEIPMDSTIEIR